MLKQYLNSLLEDKLNIDKIEQYLLFNKIIESPDNLTVKDKALIADIQWEFKDKNNIEISKLEKLIERLSDTDNE